MLVTFVEFPQNFSVTKLPKSILLALILTCGWHIRQKSKEPHFTQVTFLKYERGIDDKIVVVFEERNGVKKWD